MFNSRQDSDYQSDGGEQAGADTSFGVYHNAGNRNNVDTMSQGKTPFDCMQEMMSFLLTENKRRDDMFLTILDKVTTNQNNMSFHVMPDVSRIIGFFDGDRDSKRCDQWIESIETSAKLNKWTDSYTLETARAHLKGAALSWFDVKKGLINNWNDFKTQMKQTFQQTEGISEKWDRMKSRKQERNESVLSYFHEKVELCERLKLNFEETKEEILNGLLHKDIAISIMIKSHSDHNSLLKDILAVERVKDKTNHRYSHSNSIEPGQGHHSSNIGHRQKAFQRKCYKCGLYNHTADRCKREHSVCFKCHEAGHFLKNCPLNNDRVKSSQTKTESKNQSQNDNLTDKPKVRVIGDNIRNLNLLSCDSKIKTVQNNLSILQKTIVINDFVILKSFIDTGSDVSTIKDSIVKKYDFIVEKHSQPLYAFGGKGLPAVVTRGKIKVQVSIDSVVANNLILLVVDDSAQDIDVIIGRNFCGLEEISFMKKGDNFFFGYTNEQPFKDIDISAVVQNSFRVVKEQRFEPFGKRDVDVVDQFEKAHVLRIFNSCDSEINVEAGKSIEISDGNKTNFGDLIENKQTLTSDMINVPTDVSDVHKNELFELIKRYRDCFALSLDELGCTDVMQMNIVDNNVPVRCYPYKVSLSDRETISDIVRELKRCGLVTETTSAYSSPVLLVRKKNGDPRLVVDYRKLNKQTVKVNYPIPNMDEQFQFLANSKIYATLDLANGYMQVPLSESAREKTAFITPDTTGEFTRMTFGLTNAPFEFVRLMNLVLGPLRNKICGCYLDDVIVPARDWDELLHRLELVFSAFREAKLTLNIRKCEFGKREISYLGFLISEDGLKPGPGKMHAIRDFPQPTTVHEIRRFLGLTGFFRRFIPDYAVIARPLTELTKKQTPFDFNTKCQDAFVKLKQTLMKYPVLKLYDKNSDTELHTDASAVGIAGMLVQKDNNGKKRLVYSVSKKTTESESKYHSSRLELLAIVWSVERLRALLIGIPFKIVTDCQAIVFLNSKKSINPQVARWFNILQEYDYTLEYRKGERMSHIDALSRAPVEEASDTHDDIMDKRLSVLALSQNAEIVTIQMSDDRLKRIISLLRKERRLRTEEEQNIVAGYELMDGKLLVNRLINGKNRKLFVVPNSMRKSIVVQNHDLVGHFSVDRTIARITERYWFPRMKNYVRRHISSCLTCMISKVPAGKQPGLLNPIPPTKRPFQRIHIDNVGPFVKTSRGYEHIMVIVDSLTRFVTLYPLKSTNSSGIIRCLEDFVLKYGAPAVLVCDRGTCFTSHSFKQFCDEKGIQLVLNSPRHPQANGMVERVNRTLIPVIQAEMKAENKWDQCLKKVQWDLNTSVNKTTRQTPYKLLYGYNPTWENDPNIQDTYNTEEIELEKLRSDSREHILTNQERYKRQFDKKRYVGHTYDVGEIVMIRSPAIATGKSTKLQDKYKGPYVITEVLPADTYRIDKLECGDDERKHTSTAHVSQIKGYYNSYESEEEEEESNESDDEEPALQSHIVTPVKREHFTKGKPLQEDRPKRSQKLPEKLKDYVVNIS